MLIQSSLTVNIPIAIVVKIHINVLWSSWRKETPSHRVISHQISTQIRISNTNRAQLIFRISIVYRFCIASWLYSWGIRLTYKVQVIYLHTCYASQQTPSHVLSARIRTNRNLLKSTPNTPLVCFIEAYTGHLHHHIHGDYNYKGHAESASPQRHPKKTSFSQWSG